MTDSMDDVTKDEVIKKSFIPKEEKKRILLRMTRLPKLYGSFTKIESLTTYFE